MGRAIDMEKDIDAMKLQLERLENIVRGMSHSMDELNEKSTKTTHIDLVDDVKAEEDADGEKEANDKGSSKSSSNTKSGNGSSKSKNNKSGNSSK
jgi:hypothetical protein